MTAISTNYSTPVDEKQLKRECQKHMPSQIWNVVADYIKQHPTEVFFGKVDNVLTAELSTDITKSGIYIVKEHSDSKLGIIVAKIKSASSQLRILYRFSHKCALDHYYLLSSKWEKEEMGWDHRINDIIINYRTNSAAINLIHDLTTEDSGNNTSRETFEKDKKLHALKDNAEAILKQLESERS